MRPSHKLALIDSVARELQRRYSFPEIDAYLSEFQIETPIPFDDYSKVDYAKATMRGVADDKLIEMANDLEVRTAVNEVYLMPPRNWPDNSKFRLFISHTSRDKDKATRLRDCLMPYHIAGFVAHQDIHPTAEWQIEIERALANMDAFLAIHTVGFSQSFWTQQEIGFAVGRGVKIISFKMGEDPTGFISKRQALPRLNRSAEEVAKEVNGLLLGDETTAARLKEAIEVNQPRPRRLARSMDDDIPF
ncbi:MAG: toll/interleukin-1 receptor domain-containing protein [Bradyrhizobium sp.]|nr:toll/interleukin-1 receptor domain-containing protein [Bradyrhizobium sp.]